MTDGDQVFLEHLFMESHRAEFAPLDLPEEQLCSLLRMQARAQRAGYAKDFPAAVDQLVIVPAESSAPVGRLLLDRRTDAIHLVDIALLPSARNIGVGTQLLEELIAESEQSGLPLRLKVRPGNRAFHLYSRLGFQVTAGGMNLEMEYVPGASRTAEPPVSVSAATSSFGEEWESELGRRFTACVDGAPASSLLLARLQRPLYAGKSFSLVFYGPLHPVLPQNMYVLKAEAAHAAPQDEEKLLFLVPIGPEGDLMQYEAVFTC